MIMFSKTVTIEKFAVLNGIGEIKLIKNPNTGKNFVVADTGQSFKVSNKITSDDDLNETYEDDGAESWMGEDNVLKESICIEYDEPVIF